MKLIKIGSSQSCQLVLNNKHVSSLHAEITLLDDGQILIEDKNSLNGTFVNGKRIEPSIAITIQRGDRISFADEQLVWARIPVHESLSAYKAIYNLGTNFRNDIIINNQTVSGYHASLRIAKNGKAYIHDNGSTNGTKVNGVTISKDKDVRVKKGDNVMLSTEDITDQINPLIPSNKYTWAVVLASIAAVAAICIGVWIVPRMVSPKPSLVRTGVVYVRTIFHPIVTFEDNPMPDYWDGEINFNDMSLVTQATAFFLDNEGRMGTNRHVAVPWEELSKEDMDRIRQNIEDNLPQGHSGEDIDNFLSNSIFASTILRYSLAKCGDDRNRFVKYVLDVTSRLRKSRYTISGKIDHITVGYPGNYYSHADEFQRCNVLTVSNDKNIDLAILQLNEPKTPESVKFVFNPLKSSTKKLEPLKTSLCTIGYPAGLSWGLDENSKSLEPSFREAQCSKEPSKYDFEFQTNSVAGSSGSPVFTSDGQLVGILYGGYSIAGGATKAIHAKFLKKMYEDEVNM